MIPYHNEVILIPKNTLYCDKWIDLPKTPTCWIGHIVNKDDYPLLDNSGSYYVHQHYNINKIENILLYPAMSRVSHYGGMDNQQVAGKHLPLNNNTEVLLSCINNNMNQPVVLGSLPNLFLKAQ